MILDDLRHFRADPFRMKRAAVAAVLFILSVSIMYAIGGDTLPEQINAAAQDTARGLTPREEAEAGEIASRSGIPAVAAPYDCQRLRNGQWLRHATIMCPDGTPTSRWCKVECVYGERDPGNVL